MRCQCRTKVRQPTRGERYSVDRTSLNGHVLHLRHALKNRGKQKPKSVLARRYNVTEATNAKWRSAPFLRLPLKPASPADDLDADAGVRGVKFCKLLKLSPDDLLVLTREFINPTVALRLQSSSSRHGGNLRSLMPSLRGRHTSRSRTTRRLHPHREVPAACVRRGQAPRPVRGPTQATCWVFIAIKSSKRA